MIFINNEPIATDAIIKLLQDLWNHSINNVEYYKNSFNKIDLFNYINNIIKTNKNDFSKKIIKDIETRIIKNKKDIISLNMILQTRETYYELIIIVLKVKPKLL